MKHADRLAVANSNIHYRFYTFETFLTYQEKLGFKKVDIFGATPHVWIDAYGASDGKKMLKQVQEHGLEAETFTPEFSSMRYTLGSEGRAEEKTWDYIKFCFDFAAALETNQVIISAGGFLLDRSKEERWARFEHALGHLCDMACQWELKIYLINHYSDRTNMIRTKKDMEYAMKILRRSNLFPALDTASVYEAEENLEDWMSAFGQQLSHIRLSNTKFDGARHYWGDGYLNLMEIMEIIKKQNYKKSIGCNYMLREYLKEPWKADLRSAELLSYVFG